MVKKMITPPTNLSHEPFLTEWHADLEEGTQIWIQTSKTATEWRRLGDLYERAVLNDIRSLDLKDWIGTLST